MSAVFAAPELDFRNTNSLWATVAVETLARCGVRHAVVSPGSRSTPLTFALAQSSKIEAIPVLDERSAAFFALGLAKRTHVPTVLVCTSGTAGANYYPAVIEARESGVPLIVITADRPPEMRDCASGQTIDQQKLFGSFVSFYHELAVPEANELQLRYLRQTLRHAYSQAMDSGRGPVHLNAPFRDPLPPIEDGSTEGLEQIDWLSFFATPPEWVARKSYSIQLPDYKRGIIVSGVSNPENVDGWCNGLLQIARHTGWPILADGLSPIWQNSEKSDNGVTLVSSYDSILRSPTSRDALRPDFVLIVDSLPVSKVLREWLQGLNLQSVVIGSSADNRDALHSRSERICADLASIHLDGVSRPCAKYASVWRHAEQLTRKRLDDALAVLNDTEMFEGLAAWLLSKYLPDNTSLMVANSMPVRDWEYFAIPCSRRLRVFCNRGANGIDGTLSTAMGLAHRGAPVVLLTGDLSLLHDTNGFLQSARMSGSLTIVLIDNQGGGIFEHLPIRKFDSLFEQYWATPQSVDWQILSRSYGVELIDIAGWNHFLALIKQLPENGMRVLRLKTNRSKDAERRKLILNG